MKVRTGYRRPTATTTRVSPRSRLSTTRTICSASIKTFNRPAEAPLPTLQRGDLLSPRTCFALCPGIHVATLIDPWEARMDSERFDRWTPALHTRRVALAGL